MYVFACRPVVGVIVTLFVLVLNVINDESSGEPSLRTTARDEASSQ